jgi:hypothetical protein
VEVDADGEQHDKDGSGDQSTTRQNGGHQRVLVTEWRCGHRSFTRWPARPATSSHVGLVTPAAATTTRLRRCRPRRHSRSVVPHQVALVPAGVCFDKMVLVERPDEVQEVAA